MNNVKELPERASKRGFETGSLLVVTIAPLV